jgi:hypothetical protein
MRVMATADNRAYLASVLRTSAQILLRRTSDTLGTLYAIAEVIKREVVNVRNKRCIKPTG